MKIIYKGFTLLIFTYFESFIVTYPYGIRLSHIFEKTSISNEKPSISIEIPSISIENLGFRSKYYNHFHNILRLFNVLPNFPFLLNDARLLLINTVYTSCLTSCRTT